jgi:hypothetical protein
MGIWGDDALAVVLYRVRRGDEYGGPRLWKVVHLFDERVRECRSAIIVVVSKRERPWSFKGLRAWPPQPIDATEWKFVAPPQARQL